jgi:hypothetical protein
VCERQSKSVRDQSRVGELNDRSRATDAQVSLLEVNQSLVLSRPLVFRFLVLWAPSLALVSIYPSLLLPCSRSMDKGGNW